MCSLCAVESPVKQKDVSKMPKRRSDSIREETSSVMNSREIENLNRENNQLRKKCAQLEKEMAEMASSLTNTKFIIGELNKGDMIIYCNAVIDPIGFEYIAMLGTGMKTEDVISIEARPVTPFEYFSIQLSDDVDQRNRPLVIDIENGKNAQVRVYSTRDSKTWGYETTQSNFFPFIEEQRFELKIVCKSDSYQVAVDNKILFHHMKHMTSENVKYISFSGQIALTSVRVTRAAQTSKT